MDILMKVIIALLVFLAISSGVTKLMLMPQDVEFFSVFGFSNPALMLYGVSQIVGGILLIIPSMRVYGAIVVAITFFISLVILVMAGNILFSVFTIVSIVLLGAVIKQSKQE